MFFVAVNRKNFVANTTYLCPISRAIFSTVFRKPLFERLKKLSKVFRENFFEQHWTQLFSWVFENFFAEKLRNDFSIQINNFNVFYHLILKRLYHYGLLEITRILVEIIKIFNIVDNLWENFKSYFLLALNFKNFCYNIYTNGRDFLCLLK